MNQPMPIDPAFGTAALHAASVGAAGAGDTARERVDHGLLESILVPYKPDCRYLQKATVEFRALGDSAGPIATVHGELTIPESCYIDDTGHFNSVEFNLCYNQLVYVLIAQCIVSRRVPELATMSIGEYRRRQLPDVLIHDFHSTFRRPLDPRAFRGRVSIDTLSQRSKFLFVKTSCGFEDDAGGKAEGHVTLAIVDRA